MKVEQQRALCPVRPGDIWRVGPHLFGCGDLEQGDVLARLLAAAPPLTLVYADPPWNEGDTKRYRTLARQDSVPGEAHGWRGVFTAALRPAADRGLLAYVEMSRPSIGRATDEARRMGARIHGPWDVHYRPGWTESLMFGADFRPDGGPVAVIDGPDATTAPVQALSAHPPGVVLDPCTGNGWTARAAVQLGWVFVGHELTPRRLWTAMRRISRDGHQLVERR